MTSKDAQALVTEIKKLNPKLNDWEKGFMETVQYSLCISNKQSQCLMNIYGKATGGGPYAQKQYFKR